MRAKFKTLGDFRVLCNTLEETGFTIPYDYGSAQAGSWYITAHNNNVEVEFLLVIFIVLLPFGVIEFSSFFQIPLIVLIAMPFFLLERTAIHMQDPFENRPTDIPMTTLSQTIELNLNQMIQEKLDEKPPVNKEFYQL